MFPPRLAVLHQMHGCEKFSTEYVDENSMLLRRPGFPADEKPARWTLRPLCWNKLRQVNGVISDSELRSETPFTFLS